MTTRTTVRVSALLAATALALSSCTVPWFRDAVDAVSYTHLTLPTKA